MDPIDKSDGDALRIAFRRYGPTAHLSLAGDLDHEAGAVIARVRAAALADDVVVIACDLHHVPFMDVSGLRCLLDLQELAREHGITVLAYNWRPQPLRLLQCLNGLEADDDKGLLALRDLLREITEAQVARGIDTARATSALVDVAPPGQDAGRYEPGPPPAAR